MTAVLFCLLSDIRCYCSYVLFFFNDTATTEIYTTDTLFPYTTLFRSAASAHRSRRRTPNPIRGPWPHVSWRSRPRRLGWRRPDARRRGREKIRSRGTSTPPGQPARLRPPRGTGVPRPCREGVRPPLPHPPQRRVPAACFRTAAERREGE